MYFGRRPVFIFTSFFFFACQIWTASTHNFHSLVASRILMAFMGSATEALAAAVVADLFFLHERGWWMGVYMIFLANGGAIGAIMSGFVITGVRWRWLFWVLPLHILLT
jgi:MFS family permease